MARTKKNKEVSGEKELKISCGWCDGTGKDRGSDCPQCKGKGSIEEKVEDSASDASDAE